MKDYFNKNSAPKISGQKKSVQKKYAQKNYGFTLVELAIGLTIISVIAGGVMQGSKLVGGFRVASVTSSFEQYKIAHTEFKKQYMALPGDFGGASAIWTGATDGDDDNKIEYASDNIEQFGAWQHLGKAKLIEVQYSGTGGNTSYSPGVNIPAGTHAASGLRMITAQLNSDQCSKSATFVTYSKFESGCTTCEDIPVVTPAEALSIDRKVDDGIPGTGILFGMSKALSSSPGAGKDCATGIGKISTYSISNSDVNCVLYYSFQGK
jgi:prepilin-type N-terminal cleavage/methylation domain-containing protein